MLSERLLFNCLVIYFCSHRNRFNCSLLVGTQHESRCSVDYMLWVLGLCRFSMGSWIARTS